MYLSQDATTGLGSPNFERISNYIMSKIPVPAPSPSPSSSSSSNDAATNAGVALGTIGTFLGLVSLGVLIFMIFVAGVLSQKASGTQTVHNGSTVNSPF